MTLRGNLADFRLGDLLQTLAQNQTWGVLRLQRRAERRELAVSPKGVALLHVTTVARARIEERLASQGVLTPKDVEELRSKEKQRHALEEAIRDYRSVGEELFQSAVRAEATEQIHDLLEWSEGTFELIAAEPAAEFVGVEPLDIAGFVFEAARRQDERSALGADFPHPEQRFALTDPAAWAPQTTDESSIGDILDGRHSLRTVADRTVGDFFLVARTVLALEQRGLVRRLSWDEAADVARAFCRDRRAELAQPLLRYLSADKNAPTIEGLLEISEMQAEIGDRVGAGRTRAAVAAAWRAHERPEDALQHYRAAALLAPKEVAIRKELAELVEEAFSADRAARFQAWRDLLLAYADRGATDHVEQVEALVLETAPDDPEELAKIALALGHLGRRASGADLFVRAGNLYQAGRNRGAEALRCFREASRLAPDLKPARQKVDEVTGQLAARRGRFAMVALSLVAVGAAAGVPLRMATTNRSEIRGVEMAENLLSSNRLADARRVLDEIEPKLTDATALQRAQRLRGTLVKLADERRNAEESEADEWIRAQFAAAAEAYDLRNYEAATELYAAILRKRDDTDRSDLVKQRLLAIDNRLKQEYRRVHELMRAIASPGKVTAMSAPAAMTELSSLASAGRREALQVLAARVAEAPLAKTLNAAELRGLRDSTQQLRTALDKAAKVTEEFSSSAQASQDLQELEKILLDGRDAEARGDARAAAKSFSLLRERYRGTILKPYLEERARYWQNALAALESMERAATAGDAAAARKQRDLLRIRFPDVKLGTGADLPFEVHSSPPGARITLNGAEIGAAPLVVQKLPASGGTLRAELPGYDPVERELAANSTPGTVDLALPRTPTWSITLDGAPSGRGVVESGAWLLSDRRGTIRALSADRGEVRWSKHVDTLGGFVGNPCVANHFVFAATFEGKLYAYREQDGFEAWSCDLPGAPAFAPTALGNCIFVPMAREAVAIVSADPQPSVRLIELGSRPATDFARGAGRAAIGLQDGSVACFNSEGALLWKALEGDAPVAVAASGRGWIAFAGDAACTLAAADGSLLGKTSLSGPLLSPPADLGRGRIALVHENGVAVFDSESSALEAPRPLDDPGAKEALVFAAGTVLAGRSAVSWWPSGDARAWMRPGKGTPRLLVLSSASFGAVFEDGVVATFDLK